MRRAALVLLMCACSPGPPTERLQRTRLERLPPAQREQARRSTVPVLLPGELDLAAATVMVEPAYTAVHVPAGGVTLAIHASRVAHPRPAGLEPAAPSRPLRGTVGYITENDGIRSASWIEGGVAYALDLECADPAEARCTGDDYLVALVEGLAP